MRYLAYALIVVSSNFCVGPSPWTKISFFFIINMHRRTVINSKNNDNFAPATVG